MSDAVLITLIVCLSPVVFLVAVFILLFLVAVFAAVADWLDRVRHK